MSRTLKLSVAVGNDVYVAGTTPPADIARQITNPDAWEGDVEPVASGSGVPPKGGAGSGKDAWAAYAAANAIGVADDATRDEIVAALDSAGVPTE